MYKVATLTDETRPDFTLDQPYERYSATDHVTWRTLFERQARLLRGRACDEFLAGLDCGTHPKSRRGRGDRARLPCRAPSVRG